MVHQIRKIRLLIKSGMIREVLFVSLAEHEKVRFTERVGEFGSAGLDFKRSAAKKVRTKRLYLQRSASIQPSTSFTKCHEIMGTYEKLQGA